MKTNYPKILKNTIEIFKNSNFYCLENFATELEIFKCNKLYQSNEIKLYAGPETKVTITGQKNKIQKFVKVTGRDYPITVQFIEKTGNGKIFDFDVISSVSLTKGRGSLINGTIKNSYSYRKSTEHTFKIKGTKVFGFAEKSDEKTK